jgi:pyruvate carboxylase
MAPIMVSQGLTAQEAVEADRDIMFPASVVEMLRGDLGKPLDGWPKALQAKPLKRLFRQSL